MILDCGETWEAKRKRLEQWHEFFPLFPRTVMVENGRSYCAWLQTIERRRHYPHQFADDWWEYRLKPSSHGDKNETR